MEAAMPKNKRKTEQRDRYAPTSWGGMPSGATEFEELEVPSGQLCLVRRPGVPGLQAAGVLSSVDSLTATIARHINGDGGRITEADALRMARDPEATADMTRTIDRIVKHIVVKPELEFPPNDPTNRQPGVIYLDTVDMTDRVFLFNYALVGLRDLERFRRATDAVVDRLAAEQGLGDATSDLVVGLGPVGGVVPEPGGASVRRQPRDRAPKRRAGGTEPVARRARAAAGAGAVAGGT